MNVHDRSVRLPAALAVLAMAVAVAVLAMAVAVAGAMWATTTATAQERACREYDAAGNCIVSVEIPVRPPGAPPRGGGPNPSDPPSGGGSTTLDPNRCEWSTYPDQERWRSVYPEAPPEAVFGEWHCYRDGRILYGPYVPTWVMPDQGFGPAPTVTPEQAAQTVWLRVQATLRKPVLATDPPLDRPATIDVPTFVEVTSWQDEINEGPDCASGVCVELTATPTLYFDPGEPGAEAIECTPPGTRFDPAGADPDEQAAVPGACAHTYQRRTGVAGRPNAWPGEVRITWEVSWSAGGVDGTFDPITMSTELPRRVREAPSVVVGVE